MTVRKPPPRIDVGIQRIAEQLQRTAIDIEAGWSCANAELRNSGWPARRPADDQRDAPPRHPDTDPDDQCALDYSDPTGEQALRLDRIHDDLQSMQDHREIIEQSIDALGKLTHRYRPINEGTATPACSVGNCSLPVEARRLADGTLSHRGMEQTSAGVWLAKVGARPLCATHRNRMKRRIA